MARYEVVGACVVAKVPTADGPALRHFYPPAWLPDGVDAETVAHLLDGGLIAEVAVEAAVDPAPVESTKGKADA